MQKKLVPIVNPMGRVYWIAAVLPGRGTEGRGKERMEKEKGGRGEEKRREGVMAHGQRWTTVNVAHTRSPPARNREPGSRKRTGQLWLYKVREPNRDTRAPDDA